MSFGTVDYQEVARVLEEFSVSRSAYDSQEVLMLTKPGMMNVVIAHEKVDDLLLETVRRSHTILSDHASADETIAHHAQTMSFRLQILEAAKNGDADKVRQIIRAGIKAA